MATPKTLNERAIEAKFMAGLSKVMQHDKHHRARTVRVPASDATQNDVIIRRFNGAIITTECLKLAGHAGHKACSGNEHGVCRHSLAAIIKSLAEQGYTPRFRRSEQAALKLAQHNSTVVLTNPDDVSKPIIFTLRSHQGNHATLYFVALEDAAVKAAKKAA